MKKLETIKKTLSAENINSILTDIINNDNVDVETLTEREKFSTLIYAELAKALNSKTHKLLLDANYAQSKFHNTEQYKVDYYRFISTDTAHATMIQLYAHANVNKATCDFRVCFSCAKTVRSQVKQLENNDFVVKFNTISKRAKTTERRNIDYTEIVSVIKTICAILANANTATTADESASD